MTAVIDLAEPRRQWIDLRDEAVHLVAPVDIHEAHGAPVAVSVCRRPVLLSCGPVRPLPACAVCIRWERFT